MTVDVITFGCRLNTYESEVAKKHAQDAGVTDAVIVNTCAVTGEAVRQARQAIRKLRRERPGAKIIVTGCAAQIEPETFADMDEADHVIGNGEKTSAATFLSLAAGDLARVRVNDIASVRETAPHMISGFGSRARAYVEVQNGCDHRCTFCVIPFGRGPSRSVPAGEVVHQIRALVEDGYREVVLTGVDLTSYGADLPGEMKLGRLVRTVLRLVPELPRLRISSIDTMEADDALIDAFAEEERLMPHLHLSLQSGDNLILKRMKRRHAREDVIRFCREMREIRPDMVFGADLIAGFPTEDEAMFENTIRLADECGLSFMHVFPYSPRPKTAAARMPQLDRALVKERAARLRGKADTRLGTHLADETGKVFEVLMERERVGRTPGFTEIEIAGGAERGGIVRARATGHDKRHLIGECLA
ncbi:MiaB-like tRNA modifying enzyme [Rhodomicrobium vannielii ATCC 17100]|uniref:MiaB-like tRNA modifying enzyme n=1 Tax=Rhodomicrobium vannielii (strain ATCC 17100 / DSM 162 / LMG 4299 / NCIMB 10020 / ATH 3.1.1) TaxID=648757 RepID=E3I3B6_RHOVT|nr:tRNA (N(6)-L-threonylcarbamoyladenosine(37)-C(2))-methylthiotransferase MtaB [Rhodomicrobium vannielii]ADP71477.1 MiaB-like tRNA modifying enzyme [Rhodomicrobium vannielii ATCC 17100]